MRDKNSTLVFYHAVGVEEEDRHIFDIRPEYQKLYSTQKLDVLSSLSLWINGERKRILESNQEEDLK